MKQAFSILLIVILLLSSPVFAFKAMEEKLEGHWSKDQIDRDFLLYYFPYLAKDDFKRLNPREAFYEDEFLLSFSSLLKDKGYSRTEIGMKVKLTRIDMAKFLSEKLLEIGAIKVSQRVTPFLDLEDLPLEKKEALQDLYHAGLIKGQSKFKFNPHAYASQGEVIVLLQRVSNFLDNLKTEDTEEVISIPFTLSGIVQSYSGVEGISSKVEEDRVYVTLTKAFPTTGYSMGVEKILKEGDVYKVYLDITPPREDSIQLTVVTFKTITIEIDSKELGPPPYDFVWGFYLKTGNS